MRWLALGALVRLGLFGLGVFVLFLPKSHPSWMPRSERYAIQWRDRLEQIPTPEAAAANQEIVDSPIPQWRMGVRRLPRRAGIPGWGRYCRQGQHRHDARFPRPAWHPHHSGRYASQHQFALGVLPPRELEHFSIPGSPPAVRTGVELAGYLFISD